MLSVIECPHCLTRVLPNPEGICPACGKNTADTRGLDLSRTAMKIGPNARLPAVCFHCATPTELVYRVVRSQRASVTGQDAGQRLLWTVLSLFFGWIRAWTHLRNSARETLRVELPICESCSQNIQPEPERVDFADGLMTFVVHRQFKEQALGLRADS